MAGGIDAGSFSVKAVLLRDGEILSWATVVAGLRSVAEVAGDAFAQALAIARLRPEEIGHVVATGSGGSHVGVADDTALDVRCMARGVEYHDPSITNVLDVGAEHCVAVRCSDGEAVTVARTDSCAAGAGIFLRIVADLLELPLESMGRMAKESEEGAEIVSRCAVFAESEIISLVHSGTKTEAIVRGVYRALATRLHPLLLRVGLQGGVAVAGGGAEDVGLVQALEGRLGARVFIPPRPATVNALGAALIAGGNLG